MSWYLLDDEVFESEEELDLPCIGETQSEAVQWLKGWLERALEGSADMQQFMSAAIERGRRR